MRSRGLRLFVLLFSAVWFGVLMPVHPRGRIPVPGDRRAATCCETEACHVADSCNAKGGEASGGRDGKGPRHSAPAGPYRSCAVCQLIATLDLPTPVQFAPPPSGLAGPVLPERPPVLVRPDMVPTCTERGPPPA